LLNVLILTILATNILLLPLWRNCFVCSVLDFIKETYFYKRLWCCYKEFSQHT